MNKLTLIEGICYTNPHRPELVAGHPVMNGVWKTCAKFLKKGSIMVPLLIDERPQDGGILWQKPEELWSVCSNTTWTSLGEPIFEGNLEKVHGTSNCSELYAHYHLEVLRRLGFLVGQEWEWIKVWPLSFQNTSAKTLENLWRIFQSQNYYEVVARRFETKNEKFQSMVRDNFLQKFTCYWIDESGQICEISKPVWQSKKVVFLQK